MADPLLLSIDTSSIERQNPYPWDDYFGDPLDVDFPPPAFQAQQQDPVLPQLDPAVAQRAQLEDPQQADIPHPPGEHDLLNPLPLLEENLEEIKRDLPKSTLEHVLREFGYEGTVEEMLREDLDKRGLLWTVDKNSIFNRFLHHLSGGATSLQQFILQFELSFGQVFVQKATEQLEKDLAFSLSDTQKTRAQKIAKELYQKEIQQPLSQGEFESSHALDQTSEKKQLALQLQQLFRLEDQALNQLRHQDPDADELHASVTSLYHAKREHAQQELAQEVLTDQDIEQASQDILTQFTQKQTLYQEALQDIQQQLERPLTAENIKDLHQLVNRTYEAKIDPALAPTLNDQDLAPQATQIATTFLQSKQKKILFEKALHETQHELQSELPSNKQNELQTLIEETYQDKIQQEDIRTIPHEDLTAFATEIVFSFLQNEQKKSLFKKALEQIEANQPFSQEEQTSLRERVIDLYEEQINQANENLLTQEALEDLLEKVTSEILDLHEQDDEEEAEALADAPLAPLQAADALDASEAPAAIELEELRSA